MSKSKQMRNQKQDLTPCEELGYKIGDKFVVSSPLSTTFHKGTIVELYTDDGTMIPLFKGKTPSNWCCCDGEDGAYLKLEHVTPLVNELIVPEENALHDLHAVQDLQDLTAVPDNAGVEVLTSKMEKQEAVSTLEYKLQAIKEMREHIEDVKADLQEQENTLKTWIEQIASQLQEYGFSIVIAPEIKQEESAQEEVSDEEPLVITDWRDLQEGDIIIARGETWHPINRDKHVTVGQIEYINYEGKYPICADDDWGQDFEFVSRPSKTDKS